VVQEDVLLAVDQQDPGSVTCTQPPFERQRTARLQQLVSITLHC